MDEDYEHLLFLLLLKKRIHLQERERVKKNKRCFWVRKIFLERKQKSEFNTLVIEMKLHDHEYFKNFRLISSHACFLLCPSLYSFEFTFQIQGLQGTS